MLAAARAGMLGRYLGMYMLFLVLLACESSVKVDDTLGEDTAIDGVDTGETGDTADTEDTNPPEPETVWEEYDGERTYSGETDWGACSETTEDEGEELLDGDEYEQLMELCPDCVHVFENDPVESSLCYGIIQLGRTWRAVELDEGGTSGMIYFYGESDDGLYEAYSSEFEFDGEVLEFAYEFDLYDYIPVAVEGSMTFEMVVPE